ncbi:hypothetical protein L7F22_056417 [Adiantum nelumboides]|nr:hypothetical protein [Adiantum nelumboides]
MGNNGIMLLLIMLKLLTLVNLSVALAETAVNATSAYIELPLWHASAPALTGRPGSHNETSAVTGGALVEGRALQADAVITPPFAYGMRDYFAAVGVGSGQQGRRDLFLTIDTASMMSWLQCEPCVHCYHQINNDPVFDPSLSTALKYMPPPNPQRQGGLCEYVGGHARRRADFHPVHNIAVPTYCEYTHSYKNSLRFGDYRVGGTTTGLLVSDTFRFGTLSRPRAFPGTIFGCSSKNVGSFNPGHGVLSLGRGRLSIPTQLGHSNIVYRVFSYCLPQRYSDITSTLTFGPPPSIPAGTVYTPMVTNPVRVDQHYFFVHLTGISVGHVLLDLPDDIFQIDPRTGAGGTYIASGTTVTYMPKNAYRILRDTFRAAISASAAQLSLADPILRYLDTCYRPLQRDPLHGVPSITFHFAGGADLQVPPEHVLMPIQRPGHADNRLCLGFSGDDYFGSIVIGNVHQQRVFFIFDTENTRIGFSPPNAC